MSKLFKAWNKYRVQNFAKHTFKQEPSWAFDIVQKPAFLPPKQKALNSKSNRNTRLKKKISNNEQWWHHYQLSYINHTIWLEIVLKTKCNQLFFFFEGKIDLNREASIGIKFSQILSRCINYLKLEITTV